MAERSSVSITAERTAASFNEEAAVIFNIRRKMRAISLLAGIPIMCVLNNFHHTKSLLPCGSSSSSTESSSSSGEDPKKTVSEGEHVKEDDVDSRGDMQCVICLCNLCKGEKYRVLGECSHGFHVDCIDAWLMQNSTCPLCRCSVAYSPAGKKQQQLSNEDDDQEAYYEVVIASFLSFLDHLWTWFLNPLGIDQSCQDYHHAYL